MKTKEWTPMTFQTTKNVTIEQKRALADRIYKMEASIKTLLYLMENHRNNGIRMINTKDLAKKILTGLSDPVIQNELWLRDTLDAALEPIMAYIKQLEKMYERLSAKSKIKCLTLTSASGLTKTYSKVLRVRVKLLWEKHRLRFNRNEFIRTILEYGLVELRKKFAI